MSDYMQEAKRLADEYAKAVHDGRDEDCQQLRAALLAHIERGRVPEGVGIGESVTCERCGHENWIMYSKAPAQITDADKSAANPAAPASRCLTCNGRGIVGRYQSNQCPECNGRGVIGHSATVPAEVPMPEEIERLAVTRYRLVPNGLYGYKVVAGDGSRSIFEGFQSECNVIARKLTEAFLDGAHVALDQSATKPATPDEQAVYERIATQYFAETVPAEVPRTCSDERPCIPCFTDNGACLGPARVPASEPITDEQLLKLMKAVDPETVRLPPGIKKIAAAIENAGYVRGLEAAAVICDKHHDRARTSTGAARADACATEIRAQKGGA